MGRTQRAQRMKAVPLGWVVLLGGALMAFGCSSDSSATGGSAGAGGAGGVGGMGGSAGTVVATVSTEYNPRDARWFSDPWDAGEIPNRWSPVSTITPISGDPVGPVIQVDPARSARTDRQRPGAWAQSISPHHWHLRFRRWDTRRTTSGRPQGLVHAAGHARRPLLDRARPQPRHRGGREASPRSSGRDGCRHQILCFGLEPPGLDARRGETDPGGAAQSGHAR